MALAKKATAEKSSGERTTRDEYATARSGAGGDLNTVTAPEDFAVLIQTTLPGVKAGALVSPFAFIPGIHSATHGIHVLAAGLDSDAVRWGAGYSLALPLPKALTLEDIGVNVCEVSDDFVRAQAAALTDDFVRVCDEFVAKYEPEPSGTERPVAEAWEACGFKGYENDGTPLTTTSGGLSFIENLIEVKTRKPKGKLTPGGLEELTLALSRAARIAPSRAALAAFSIDRGLSCHNSDDGRKKLSAAAKQYEWTQTRGRFGVRYTEDRRVRLWGLNPDPNNELSNGDLSERRAVVEGAIQHGRVEFVLSGGYYGGKVEVSDDGDDDTSNERESVHGATVGATISAVLFAIDGERLRPKGSSKVRAKDGVLPPRLATGFDVQTVLLAKRPDSQESPWQQVQLTPFFDVLISDSLRFRVGAPVTAKAVLRPRTVDGAGNETRAEERGLQWKASALIFTVLKL